MIVLDTDHISELQYPKSTKGMRLFEESRALTPVTSSQRSSRLRNQMRGWLAMINKRSAGMNQVAAYDSLAEVQRFYLDWVILPFDRTAAEQFHDL